MNLRHQVKITFAYPSYSSLLLRPASRVLFNSPLKHAINSEMKRFMGTAMMRVAWIIYDSLVAQIHNVDAGKDARNYPTCRYVCTRTAHHVQRCTTELSASGRLLGCTEWRVKISLRDSSVFFSRWEISHPRYCQFYGFLKPGGQFRCEATHFFHYFRTSLSLPSMLLFCNISVAYSALLTNFIAPIYALLLAVSVQVLRIDTEASNDAELFFSIHFATRRNLNFYKNCEYLSSEY